MSVRWISTDFKLLSPSVLMLLNLMCFLLYLGDISMFYSTYPRLSFLSYGFNPCFFSIDEGEEGGSKLTGSTDLFNEGIVLTCLTFG